MPVLSLHDPHALQLEAVALGIIAHRLVPSDQLAVGLWQSRRLTSTVGMFSLGAQRYNAGTKYARQTLEITFDPQTCDLVCLPEKTIQPIRLLAKGLTQEALMGELDPLMTIPVYQLALPLSRQAWREMMLCRAFTDTTL